MRCFLFIYAIGLAGLSMAQDTIRVYPSDESEVSRKLQKACTDLGLPLNAEGNIDLLNFTIDWRGTPYCYGGSSKSCTDCSGFTSNAYKEIYKKSIPRVSRDIYANSMPIRKNALYQGDLVFFATAGGDRITHVGIYLWDGYFAHASSSKGVTVSNLRSGYYRRTFVSGGAWID